MIRITVYHHCQDNGLRKLSFPQKCKKQVKIACIVKNISVRKKKNLGLAVAALAAILQKK